jgi:MFS family permease
VIPPLLRESPDFRRFFLGQSVSLLGDQVSAIALPLTAVLALHATAGQMGALTTVYLIPNLLFSLHVGAWVDRRGARRRIMLAADGGRAIAIATVPVAYAVGHLTWAQLYVVAFVTGALSVVFFVAYGGLFQALVPRERYVEASSLLHGSRAFSFVAGSTLGGALVQLLRGPYALALDAVSYVWSALFLGRMRVDEPPGAPAESGGIAAGVQWLRRNPYMRPDLLGVATINYFNFIFFALFILYATRSLGVRPTRMHRSPSRRSTVACSKGYVPSARAASGGAGLGGLHVLARARRSSPAVRRGGYAAPPTDARPAAVMWMFLTR